MQKIFYFFTFICSFFQSAPEWMHQQIHHDLSPYHHKTISKEAMKDYFWNGTIPKTFVEIQIKKNKIKASYPKELKESFLRGWMIPVRKALRELAAKYPLPDVTFYIFINDGYNYDVEYPLFVFFRRDSIQGQCLMPDCFNLNSNYNILPKNGLLNYEISWKDKIEKLIWRGSTGQYVLEDKGKTGRTILCELSRQFPSLIDAGFTFSYTEEDPAQKKLLDTFGKEKLSYEELVKSKYLIWIDGFSASFANSGWRLFANSVVFKPDSDCTQWYYQALKPYIHYVPVEADLSDLVEKIQWMQTHDEEAQMIAKTARSFALNNITHTHSLIYLYNLIWEYSKLNFSP